MLPHMMLMGAHQSFVPSEEQLKEYPHPFELLMEIEVTESELLQVLHEALDALPPSPPMS